MKGMLLNIGTAFSLSLLLVSCGGNDAKTDYSKEVDEGKFKGDTYRNDVLGWEMTIPSTWKITNKSSLESADKVSKELMGSDTATTHSIKRLLAFQKDFDNNFQSTRESFEGKTKEDYNRIIKSLRNTLYNGYIDQKTGIDTNGRVEKIDGLDFDCFVIDLFDEQGKPFAHQLLYSRLIAGNYFTAVVNFNNEKDKKRILDAFKKSTFTKKD